MITNQPIEFETRIFDTFRRYFKYDDKIRLTKVDFNKPWWHIFITQKWLVLIQLLNSTIGLGTISILPIGIAFAIQNNDWNLFIIFILGIIAVRLITHVLYYYDSILRIQTATSLTHSAYEHLLVVDPTYHSTRSSGQVISKINRGGKGIETIMEIFFFQILGVVFFTATTVFTLGVVNWKYGLATFIIIVGIIILNSIGFIWRSKYLSKTLIKAEDKALSANIESMQQISFIRAAFATNEQIQKMRSNNKEQVIVGSTVWRVGGSIITITQILFFIGFLGIGYVIFHNPTLSQVLKLSILITYLNLSARLLDIGRSVDRLTQGLEGLQDLFKFIRNFGTQTYPVIQNDSPDSITFQTTAFQNIH